MKVYLQNIEKILELLKHGTELSQKGYTVAFST